MASEECPQWVETGHWKFRHPLRAVGDFARINFSRSDIGSAQKRTQRTDRGNEATMAVVCVSGTCAVISRFG